MSVEDEIYRLRGEFITTAASVEYWTSLLTTELLEVGKHRYDFDGWLMSASIPQRERIRLFELVFAEWGESPDYEDLTEDLRNVHRFRNVLAYSFGFVGPSSYMTSRGKDVPLGEFTVENITSQLERAKRVESTLSSCWNTLAVGPPEYLWQEFMEGDVF